MTRLEVIDSDVRDAIEIVTHPDEFIPESYVVAWTVLRRFGKAYFERLRKSRQVLNG